MSLMAQYSTQCLSEGWRKERASMGIHGLSSTIKSVPFLTCNMLWFIPEPKYYKNNVSPTKYDQLLSALAAVKERYILLTTRELTQLSVEVATFWQIFHSPQRCSSKHRKEARSELPCVGCARGENPTYTAPLCSWLWQAAPSPAVSVPVHRHTREKLGFSSLIIGTFLSWGASTWRMRLLLVGWEYLCLGRLPETHPQLTYSSCQRQWSSDMNTRACAKRTAKGSRPRGRETAELQALAHGPAPAAWPQPGGTHPTSGNLLAHHAIKQNYALAGLNSSADQTGFCIVNY